MSFSFYTRSTIPDFVYTSPVYCKNKDLLISDAVGWMTENSFRADDFSGVYLISKDDRLLYTIYENKDTVHPYILVIMWKGKVEEEDEKKEKDDGGVNDTESVIELLCMTRKSKSVLPSASSLPTSSSEKKCPSSEEEKEKDVDQEEKKEEGGLIIRRFPIPSLPSSEEGRRFGRTVGVVGALVFGVAVYKYCRKRMT